MQRAGERAYYWTLPKCEPGHEDNGTSSTFKPGRRWCDAHRQNAGCRDEENFYLTFTLAYLRHEEAQLGQLKWRVEKRR